MKHKRLDRDTWWEFKNNKKPHYYQMRIDTDCFHGMACVLCMIDGAHHYWKFPKSGKVEVTGAGITWLQLLPDDSRHLISAYYKPVEKQLCGKVYRDSVTVWYVDITDGYYYDSDGVVVYRDMYLDVIFTPVGDFMIADRDELDAALSDGDITEEQHRTALEECDRVVDTLCSDIKKTEILCADILDLVKNKIDAGEWELSL